MDTRQKKLNKRQDAILSFIAVNGVVAPGLIMAHIQKFFGTVTRITVTRDLATLLHLDLVARSGAGRATRYSISPRYALIRDIDREAYFMTDSDRRDIRESFNFDIFESLTDIFSEDERKTLDRLNTHYLHKMSLMPEDGRKKEMERLIIDFSWKSSKIEGNTYDLLETEQLIRNQQQATGHTQEEATMILNHKTALEYVRGNKAVYRTMTPKKIEDIHALLTDGMGITKGIRKSLVRIIGTRYAPIDNEFQIHEALQRTCSLVNEMENSFEKAVTLMLLVAYIQPFTDGNKRTSRIVGNAVLQTHDCCPLSYRSMDEVEYKKAMILFYEQNNISYFKELFLNQFSFAVENYFG
jgi:fido (protein-threonine AMPylation protein)